ncbi:sensor histidine kinase [Amycolatopsis sp. YIM 10]|uniref:sensor histidine kinase n=1 Tax=Amycolatopsis sp. YIM 10 TaxID=2653857 RepID=UPI001290282C|nr:histidine kinase [Amycolatopsis sp. YIM 10]
MSSTSVQMRSDDGRPAGFDLEPESTGKPKWLPDLPPKLAFGILAMVLAGLSVNATLGVIFRIGTFWDVLFCILCVVAMTALQLGYVSRPGAVKTPRRTAWVLLGQALLVGIPILEFGPRWHGFTGVFLGSVLLLLPAVVAWPVLGTVVALMGFLEFTRGAALVATPWAVVNAMVATTLTAMITYGLSRLVRLVSELHSARHDLSRMAVASERLRFSRDVHDLLGLSLSAITLKTELTNRLLTDFPDRARKELEDMLVMSRRALADVRLVASGRRRLSFDEECRQARSALSAADVDVRIERDDRELEGPAGTVLATVLREGVTNVLRHSEATWCEISVREVDGVIRLTITNDGVTREAADTAPGAGNGTRNLSHRVSQLGGELAASAEDGRYRLQVDVPLSAVLVRGDAADGPEDAGAQAAKPLWTPGIAPKMANAILAVVLGAVVVNTSTGIAVSLSNPWQGLLSASIIGLLAGLQFGYVSRAGAERTPLRTALVLLAQAALVFLPILHFGPLWHGLVGLFAGSALVLLPSVAAVPLAALALVAIGTLELLTGLPGITSWYSVPFVLVGNMITTLVVFGLSRLVRLVGELHAARDELSRMAVAEERLRFSRDVHDLLGLSLSAITLKTELTNRLLTEYPERARKELEDMLVLSRRALADVRMVASGKRELSLDEECKQAKSALSAAEVDVRISRDARELDGPVGTVLATVLREGVTNVLRHSEAEWCEISVRDLDGSVRLVIANDGVTVNGAAPAPNAGNGIRNLSHRLSRLGGELSVETDPEGRYRLRADVPLAAISS